MKRICIIFGLIALFTATCLSGCSSAAYECDAFTIGRFKDWKASSEESKEYAGSSIYLLEPGKEDNASGSAYIHLWYRGETEAEEGTESEESVSFRTGDIIWKGVSEVLMNGTSLVIVGVNEKTGERWQITGYQYDGTTEEPVYTVEDVEKWVKTIKLK